MSENDKDIGAKTHPPIGAKNLCTYRVYDYMDKGLRPCEIYQRNLMPKRTVMDALNKLHEAGYVKKITKGIWDITKPLEMGENLTKIIGAKTHGVGRATHPLIGAKLAPNTVRGHGLVSTLLIPKIRSWERRADIMNRSKIEYEPIVQGQRIIFKGCKIWLCKDSVVIYHPKGSSWFGDNARKVARKAMMDTLDIIRSLERHLHVSTFQHQNQYMIAFSRQHYGLIKNDLAAEYERQGKTLECRGKDGKVWMLIDNSFNYLELETVHPVMSVEDNMKAQHFMNAMREAERPGDIFKFPKAVEEFKDMLMGFVQQGVAAANAQMYSGAAMKQQTAILSRMEQNMSAMGTSEDTKSLTTLFKAAMRDKVVKIRDAANIGTFTGDKDVQVKIIKDMPKVLIDYRGVIREIGPFPVGARGLYLNWAIADHYVKMGYMEIVKE